jgi:hypothetical protein
VCLCARGSLVHQIATPIVYRVCISPCAAALRFRVLDVGCSVWFGLVWFGWSQIVYAVSMFLKVKCLACCANAWVWMLLIIVCLSAALHGILAFLFADICYEFDLHLATYYLPESPEYGGYENLNFLPPEAAKFCGPDGSLAFMTEQFDEQLDASIQMAIDVVVRPPPPRVGLCCCVFFFLGGGGRWGGAAGIFSCENTAFQDWLGTNTREQLKNDGASAGGDLQRSGNGRLYGLQCG